MADEAQKRETAVYNDTRNRLRHGRADLSDEQIDAIALEAVETAVFGHDAAKDRHGNRIQQGIGSPGHETSNHFASIRRWEGEESYRRAVADLWHRNPEHAKRLGLPQPRA
jgi:hypothetical protein